MGILSDSLDFISLEHKERVLRNLVDYSSTENSTKIDLNIFANLYYPNSKVKLLMPAIYSLLDDRCIELVDGDIINLLPSAYNYLQTERIKNKNMLKEGLWDLMKLILAALMGALLAKYIR